MATLETLGIVARDGNGTYVSVSSKVKRGSPEDALRHVLRRALHRYQPFELICEGLSYGESEIDATRKAAAQLGLRATDRSKLRPLVRWGLDLGVFRKNEEGELKLTEEMLFASPQAESVLSAEDVESEAKARLYVGRRLGRRLSTKLDGVNKDLLVQGLLVFQADPKRAADNAGQALENFLRELATAEGLTAQARRRTGAGQLANLLREKDLILPKHVNWIMAVGALRNATGHSKDKDTVEVWELDEQSGFWGISVALSLIRSIYEYTMHARQII